jgi:anti-sigma factor RsiW
MITCEQCAELIGSYVDSELPDEARRRVENHLLLCRDCAWEAQTLRITRERLRDGIGEVVASDAFRARALSHLRQGNPHIVPAPNEPDPAQYQLPFREQVTGDRG